MTGSTGAGLQFDLHRLPLELQQEILQHYFGSLQLELDIGQFHNILNTMDQKPIFKFLEPNEDIYNEAMSIPLSSIRYNIDLPRSMS